MNVAGYWIAAHNNAPLLVPASWHQVTVFYSFEEIFK